MNSLITAGIAALAVFLSCEIAVAQSGNGGNTQSGLRARLPFTGPENTGNGQRGTNPHLRPTTGSSNPVGYGGWAGSGYPRGAGVSSATQSYARGRGPMRQMQRPNGNGVAASNFNPANANVQLSNQLRGSGQSGPAYSSEEFAWMDDESGVPTGYPVGGTGVGSNSLPTTDSNAADAQAATAAATSGANWPVPANGQTSQEGVATSQQVAPWRFYNTPAYNDMPTQQPLADRASTGNAAPTQSQKPAGVADAATSAPIKF